MSVFREFFERWIVEMKKEPVLWAITIMLVILPLVVFVSVVSESGIRGIQYAEAGTGVLLYLNAVKIILDAIKSPTPFFDDISGLCIKWIMSNLTSIVFLVVFIFGFAFLIIPGYYIFVQYSFAPLISIDTGENPLEAFKKSSALVVGFQWKMAGIVAALFVGNYLLFQIGENIGITGITFSLLLYSALYEWLKGEQKDLIILNSGLKK